MRRLLDEAEKGWKSAEKDGWVSEEDAYRTLGITESTTHGQKAMGL